jgi:ribonuclease HI
MGLGKGHEGNAENEKYDSLAQTAIESFRLE